MQRVYDFLRRHPTEVDGFWALVLMSVSLAAVVGGVESGTGNLALIVPFVVLLCLAMALRRRFPERMLRLGIALGLGQLALDVAVMVADFALLAVVHTAAATGGRRASRVALVAGLCAAPLAQLRWPGDQTGPAGGLLIATFQAVPFALAWVLGDSVRTRRAYLAELEERAARLEREREARDQIAVAAERARIAREMHDVVAHDVSVMVVQADGAAFVLDTAPDQARTALEAISSTGRQALAEMRRLLGVLRTGEPGQEGDYLPQPDVGRIGDLVEQCRGAGLPVDFRVEGTPRALPGGVELTAYRIVQEALTNTRKHGGPDAGASVRLVYFDDGLGLLVEDDGRGATREVLEARGTCGEGHGLIGMRERVGMVGGTLDVGPRAGGGFRISALLPLGSAL
ncbi:sensor histidine kinase [Streptomyces sp. ZYX-F-203]